MKTFLTVLYIIACIGLVISVLFQDEGSMAGAGGSFGKNKGPEDKLSMLTKICATSFLVLAILMTLFAI